MQNGATVPVDINFRVHAVGGLLGEPTLLAPVEDFPVNVLPIIGGPFDEGDAHAWFDALPTLTSCVDPTFGPVWIPWFPVTLRYEGAWFDTWLIDNSANCWDMNFDVGVNHLGQCCN